MSAEVEGQSHIGPGAYEVSFKVVEPQAPAFDFSRARGHGVFSSDDESGAEGEGAGSGKEDEDKEEELPGGSRVGCGCAQAESIESKRSSARLRFPIPVLHTACMPGSLGGGVTCPGVAEGARLKLDVLAARDRVLKRPRAPVTMGAMMGR